VILSLGLLWIAAQYAATAMRHYTAITANLLFADGVQKMMGYSKSNL
jgi:prepilin-type processing-associated H-X9-DG protein